MNRKRFDDLVRWVETRYDGRQPALERSVAAWIRIGLAGVFCWLGVLFGLGAAAVAAGVIISTDHGAGVLLLAVGVLVLVYAISQAGYILLAEGDRPEGRLLRPGEAPGLVAMLTALREELDCRPFDEVRITMAFNAGVREFPRLGLLGWVRSVLEIGLPLTLTLSPEELRAVLAHEFAHLSARHGLRGNRIYRLQRAWSNVVARMQRPITGTLDRAVRGAVSRFLGWYWPRLHARAMVLSRMHEFQADRVAASTVGGDTAAMALWRIECRGLWIVERFWPDLYQLAGPLADPPDDLANRLRQALSIAPEAAEAARWIDRALSRVTDNDNSHPALLDRLHALGKSANEFRLAGFPKGIEPSAANALLGSEQRLIEKELTAEWQRTAKASWRDRNRREAAQAQRHERANPAAPAASASSSISVSDLAALWDAARETAELRGPDAAEPLLRSLLEHAPGHAGASVMLGHSRLRQGDPEGERLLLQVVERSDETWMHPACGVLETHYRDTGQADRLRQVRARLDSHDAAVECARRERSTVNYGDVLLPHGLDSALMELLRGMLAGQPECSAAWLVRKELQFFPDRPLFILCVNGKSSGWGSRGGQAEQNLVRLVSQLVRLPGQVLVISKRAGFHKLARRIRARKDAQIYP